MNMYFYITLIFLHATKKTSLHHTWLYMEYQTYGNHNVIITKLKLIPESSYELAYPPI